MFHLNSQKTWNEPEYAGLVVNRWVPFLHHSPGQFTLSQSLPAGARSQVTSKWAHNANNSVCVILFHYLFYFFSKVQVTHSHHAIAAQETSSSPRAHGFWSQCRLTYTVKLLLQFLSVRCTTDATESRHISERKYVISMREFRQRARLTHCEKNGGNFVDRVNKKVTNFICFPNFPGKQ